MATHATAAAIDQLWNTVSIEDSFVRIAVAAKALGLPRLVFRNATKSSAQCIRLFGARVAIGAIDLTVCSIDRESGPVLVVKLGMIKLRPCIRLVTCGAIAPGFGIENYLALQERVPVRVLVAALAPDRRTAEDTHVVSVDQVVTRGAVLLCMLTRQRQRRTSMHLDIKRVRHKVRALVATDTILACQRTLVKLPAMRILMTGATIVGPAAGMPLSKRASAQVALRAGHFLMRLGQREARVPVVLRRHHETWVIEVLVIQHVATDTTRLRRQTVGLGVAGHEALRVWRVMARGATAAGGTIRRPQLLECMVSIRLVARAAIGLTMRTFERQPPVVVRNEPLGEGFLRVTRHARHLHLPAMRVAVTRGAITRQP
jgi:hypothetical protein